jgi:hypothetical protein
MAFELTGVMLAKGITNCSVEVVSVECDPEVSG